MKEENEDFRHFLSGVQEKLQGKYFLTEDTDDLAKMPVYEGQCIYVLNYVTQQLTFQKGVKEMLGYSEEEFTFDFVLNNYHPDDLHIVRRVLSAALQYNIENNIKEKMIFKLCYRVRKKNGDFIKVLRTSATREINEKGNMVSNISTITDISFLNMGSRVEWYFESQGLNGEKFRQSITKSFAGYFSPRHAEIVKMIAEGLSSEAIAKKLGLSKHTVDTHRRMLLKKTNSQNTIELINFCSRNGII